jgi:hypothetical protein
MKRFAGRPTDRLRRYPEKDEVVAWECWEYWERLMEMVAAETSALLRDRATGYMVGVATSTSRAQFPHLDRLNYPRVELILEHLLEYFKAVSLPFCRSRVIAADSTTDHTAL